MTPPLPQPITVEGCRLMFTRAQLLEYGLARAEAAYQAGYRDGQRQPKAAPSDDLSKLFKTFGMKP